MPLDDVPRRLATTTRRTRGTAKLLLPRPLPFFSHVEEFTIRMALAFGIARARMRNARAPSAATVSVLPARASAIAGGEDKSAHLPPLSLPWCPG